MKLEHLMSLRLRPWLRLRKEITFAICLAALVSCKPERPGDEATAVLHLIPAPASVSQQPGGMMLSVGLISAPDTLNFESDLLADLVERRAKVAWIGRKGVDDQAAVQLILDDALAGDEDYHLEVTPNRVEIRGKTPAGVFYGIQTFSQLLPIEPPGKNEKVTVPCVVIDDHPRFSYRGMHLDVSRHFFDVAVVKKYLDILARYKFNYFHWHLTDDQGWRVQIDAYPKLNTISSWRDETLIGHHNDKPWKFDGTRHGGFYTKDQIRDVIAYAAARHITIVPEIEMPGHSQAVVAAYPEFGCTGNAVDVRKVWSISEDVLCPKEETFHFLETVLGEVIDLFPGKYIHIGGDECPKVQWKQNAFCQQLMQREGLANEDELQSWFVHRIEKYINGRGRVMIGWDEILEGGLAPNAVVMSWRGNEGGIAAAKEDHDVIMTPTTHVYFDYYQSTHPDEPFAIGGFLPLETVYGFEPVPTELNTQQATHILGAQGNVWTEYIETPLKLDYMAWPRGVALAEVVWSPKEKRNFADFTERLASHLNILRQDGIYAANHLFDLDYSTSSQDGNVLLEFHKMLPSIVVNYSIDDEQTWQPIAGKMTVENSMDLVARSEGNKGFVGRELTLHIDKHLGAGKAITVVNAPEEKYNNGGIQSMVNGIHGSDTRYGDKEWRGFLGKDLDAIIDLGGQATVSSIDTRCFSGEGQLIYLPQRIEVSFSSDNTNWSEPQEMTHSEVTPKIHTYTIAMSATDTRYVRVHAVSQGKVPEGKSGAGRDAWLFVDEIEIK